MPSESRMGDEWKKRLKIISLSSEHFPHETERLYICECLHYCVICVKEEGHFYQNFDIRKAFFS